MPKGLAELRRKQSKMQTLTEKYKPYPAYRPSGVEWLGEVPTHWEVNRLKVTVQNFQNGVWGAEPNGENEIACVRVADFDRIRLRAHMDKPTLRSIEPSVIQTHLLHSGDLLLEGSGGGEKQPVGAVVLYDSEEPAVCSNFIAQLRPLNGFESRFLAYLHFTLYSARVNVQSIKQSTGIQNLDKASYLSEAIALPPLPEQRAIAAFLDRETATIDALVAKKERLIELLQEKRTALITRAVTTGLDLNAPIKDSGVEWLAEIPKDWEVKRLKHMVSKIGSGKTPKGGAERYVTEGVMLLRSQNVHFGGLHLGDVAYIDAETDAEMAGSRVGEGDVLLNITGASLGRSCVARLGGIGANVNQHVCVLRPDQQQDKSEFLAYSLESRSLQDQIFNNENGVSRDALNFEQIGDLLFARPAISEQQAIADFLDRETAKLDALVAKGQEAIDRLKELRTALISAAATGRIDVRAEAG